MLYYNDDVFTSIRYFLSNSFAQHIITAQLHSSANVKLSLFRNAIIRLYGPLYLSAVVILGLGTVIRVLSRDHRLDSHADGRQYSIRHRGSDEIIENSTGRRCKRKGDISVICAPARETPRMTMSRSSCQVRSRCPPRFPFQL